ncbi:BZ3500_MvSof-1268-A1-R1_Chr2-2g04819 [Microbotryum saponariae]|uniref:BZ3500_MvSof-1268-A1-R1_Chr2-2g04819 protein n=1 Tax=Microbotryum saponariae TaxID=289078 RepID=A0A2X0KWG7_9BASI|nr:BZ3500_MvSof-1268-A1-R1_Chr2-2g04819 [Microbotryum saponariae]SDA00243.1 BZ3501_MvSof-1269-A2-R1_Chr2-2g04493 [Microbotryum saponariae]
MGDKASTMPIRPLRSIATSDDDWSVDDEIDRDLVQSWDGDRPPSRKEQLPSNAVVSPSRKRRTKSTTARLSSNEGSPVPNDRLPYVPPSSLGSSRLGLDSGMSSVAADRDRVVDERSPLIAPTLRDSSTSATFSPANQPSPNRGDRLSPLLSPSAGKPQLQQQRRISGKNNAAARRLSIISSEAWSAAIEEQRGESTWGQTLFNTVNVLIGVGLLAEPFAFADAGWAIGTLLLLFCALITNYTGKMLAKIMRQDSSLATYADVLIKAYGTRAKNIECYAVILELGALSIALCTLFADSMESLYPAVSSQAYKVIFFFIILPTTFLPLRFLSLTSLLGIISSFTLLLVLVTDGALKKHQPGSLRDPMPTAAGPRWMRLPLSFGLLMSGLRLISQFAGHAVIPSLYRDMKNPSQFNSVIDIAYIIAFSISMLFGTLGYIMFGNNVSSEVTRDLLATKGNPAVLNKIAVWMVALNPVVKYAVANAPLVQTFEVMLGIQKTRPLSERRSRPRFRSPHDSDASAILEGSAIMSEDSSSSISGLEGNESSSRTKNQEPFLLRYRAFITRPLLTALIVVLAIVIPDFGRVLSFLGSASAFIICCIGPIGAYLILGRQTPSSTGSTTPNTITPSAMENVLSSSVSKSRLGGDEASKYPLVVKGLERVVCWSLLIVSVCLAITGTVWSVMPLERSD